MAVSLSELIPETVFPIDKISSDEGLPSILERILVEQLDVRALDPGPGGQLTIELKVEEEVVFGIPGLDGVMIVFGGRDASTLAASIRLEPDQYELRISAGAKLRFSRELLRPVAEQESGWVDDPTRSYSEIDINTAIIIGQDWSVAFDDPNEFALKPSMIGDTGIVVSADNVKLDMSRSYAIPEVIAAGFGNNFMGVFIEHALVHLPSDFSLSLPENIIMNNCVIGSGGFSGKVTATFNPQLNNDGTGFEEGNGAGEVFGIPFGMKSISLEFKQNTFVDSSIQGSMILPFFDGPVDVNISLTNDGNFAVGLLSTTGNGLVTLTKQDLLELQLKNIAFEKQEDLLLIEIGGTITPLFGGFGWPSFEVESLTIDSRGRVRIAGGWLHLREKKTFDLYGVALEVSAVGFGTEDDGTRWIGFSGGLKLCEGLPMSGAVEGLRVNWKGEEIWLEFSGAEVAFEIPDAIEFTGRVAFIEDPKEPKDPSLPKTRGFKGGGKLKVIPTGLEIDAQLVIGKNDADPSYTFFYIFVDTQLPAGIPLGNSGVAFYGFGGLFGYNMVPNRRADQPWFDGWYRGHPTGVTSSEKWDAARDNFALGTLVTLGSATDNGYGVSTRALLALVLPGPILMIEGKASFLRERSKLTDDTPVTAFAVLDAPSEQFLLYIDAHFPPPSDNPKDMAAGLMLEVDATADAFFDLNNPNNWHLFLGQRTPPEKRVRAKVYSLYEGNAYLMLYPERFLTGTQVGYNGNWQFGPLGVILQAMIEGGVQVSWKPVQLGGQIGLIGQLALRAFGFSTGLAVGAGVEVEAPTPYRVYAEVYAKINLPWPLDDQEAQIELEWQEATPPPTPIPLSTVGVEHLKVSEKWVLERYPRFDVEGNGLWYSDSQEEAASGQVEQTSPIVPLDAKVVLSFSRPMVDAAHVGNNPSGIPAPERSGDYEFQYRLAEIALEKRSKVSPAGWVTAASRNALDPDVDKEKLWGSWLAVSGETPSSGDSTIPPMTKLMLFSKSPFEYARETIDDPYYDRFQELHPTYGMAVVNPPQKECVNFDGLVDKRQNRYAEIRVEDVIFVGRYIYFQPGNASQKPHLKLGFHTMYSTVIVFPEPIRQVELLIGKSRAVAKLFHGTHQVGRGSWALVNDETENKSISFPSELDDDFNLVVIEGNAQLVQVCYITAAEAERCKDEQDTADHAASAGDVYEYPVETELLSPDSYYRVKLVTEALRRRAGQGDFTVIKEFEEYAYFQTAGPPGIFVPLNNGAMTPSAESEHYPERGPLQDLRAYVAERDQTLQLVPREGAVAVYRSYDVGVEFNEAYVEHMYMLSGRPLSIYLFDNNGEGVQLAEQEIPAIGNSWRPNKYQFQRRADLEWESTLARTQQNVSTSRVPKVDLKSDQVPQQSGIWAGGEDMVLKPQTMYRAALIATEPKVVIPLTTEGEPIRMNDNLQYVQVAPDGSNFVSALEDSFGQAEVGIKIVSDGISVIVTNMRASDTAQSVPIDRQKIDTVVKEALANVAPTTEPRSVFSWSFITSRFTSFLHHIHSFVDAAWDLRGTMGAAAWPDLTQAQQDELKGLIETPDPDLNMIYDKSIEYFGLEDRPLPERLEINVLEDANGRYGFMIESPEPIQWEVNEPGRVTIEKAEKAVDTVDPPSPAFGIVKFVNCVLSGDGDEDEVVDILVQDDVDLAGYKIEHAYNTTTPFDTYYEFAPDSHYRAGIVIRIHSGEAPFSASPNPEVKDLYIGSSAEILSNDGETLRLVDSEGTEIHRRKFIPTTFAEFSNIVLAPDSDGTRTFIYFLDDNTDWLSQLEQGTYRLTWAFKRNAGNNLPILRRFGSADAEQAVLEFNIPAQLP